MAVGTVFRALRVTEVQTLWSAGMDGSAQRTRDHRDRLEAGNAAPCSVPRSTWDPGISLESAVHLVTPACPSPASTAARAAARRAMGTRYGEQDT